MPGDLQNLRRFTVQILDRALSKVIGTGAVVSRDGHVATCAHVVAKAGVDPAALGGEVGVRRPKAPDWTGWQGIATLIATAWPDYGDDLVLLRLLGDRVFDEPERRIAPPNEQTFDERDFARLGSGKYLEDEGYRTWGYPNLDRMSGGDRSQGVIEGAVPPPTGKPWRIEPLRVSARDAIVPGMSGAPVLATSRNHVVGFIFGRYGKADAAVPGTLGWAADARELAEAGFGLRLETGPYVLPKEQRLDDAELHAAAEAAAAAEAHRPSDPRSRPPSPNVWVGRPTVFNELNAALDAADTRVVGVIGLGGQGKSTLVARWLEQVPTPAERVFWWTFGTGDVDRFLADAVAFVGSDPAEIRRPLQQAQRIVAAAKATEFILVLDGLEAAQHQEGEAYGSFSSAELAAFLESFAGDPHRAFCVITSRAPINDLFNYSACDWIDLERLSTADGEILLRRLGARGTATEVRELVECADGHPLTLTLLGAYLVERFQGRIPDVDIIGLRVASGDHVKRVQAVLREYDALLTDADRAVMRVLGAENGPVSRTLIRQLAEMPDGLAALAGLSADEALGAAERLSRLRILEARDHDGEREYVAHAIVGAYYRAQLAADRTKSSQVHRALAAAHVAGRAAPALERVTLAALEPFMRAVAHGCAAGDFDAAYRTYTSRVDQLDGERGVLAYRLGGYEADLRLVLGFFPDRDFTRVPCLRNARDNEYLLRSVGLGLMTVGRLLEAFPVCRRSREAATALEDTLRQTRALQLLAELNIHTGRFADAADMSRLAFAAAALVDDEEDRLQEEACSLAYEAWAYHLRGEVVKADALFSDAQARKIELSGAPALLDDLWGVYHAEHLRRTGRRTEAANHVRANMRTIGIEQPEVTSECHRVLGDIALDEGGPGSVAAEAHYSEALKIARTITHRAILLEAMLGRGRLAAERGDVAAAQLDLFAVLDMARASSYALYAADAQLHLGRAYMRGGEEPVARHELTLAGGAAEAIGYRWTAQESETMLAAV